VPPGFPRPLLFLMPIWLQTRLRGNGCSPRGSAGPGVLLLHPHSQFLAVSRWSVHRFVAPPLQDSIFWRTPYVRVLPWFFLSTPPSQPKYLPQPCSFTSPTVPPKFLALERFRPSVRQGPLSLELHVQRILRYSGPTWFTQPPRNTSLGTPSHSYAHHNVLEHLSF